MRRQLVPVNPAASQYSDLWTSSDKLRSAEIGWKSFETPRRTHPEEGTPAQHRLTRRQRDQIPAVHRDQAEAGHEALLRAGQRAAVPGCLLTQPEDSGRF